MCGQCNLRELNNDVFATVGVFFQVTLCLLSGGDSMQRKWMSNIV
jgi:hypothetical protein